ACHCGLIRYEAEIDPGSVGLCHCADCQQISGSAFRIVVQVPRAQFRMLGAAPKVYVKTAESGTRRAQAFCPECGTSVYASAAVDDPPILGLRVGALRQCAELRPSRQIWCRSKLPWVPDLPGVPSFEKGPPA
ncbi:MAG: GFA family protein, partial [Betaproteobacteria bacterium]|nr:GFA family protein [Betaproteobacteria bacterium]